MFFVCGNNDLTTVNSVSYTKEVKKHFNVKQQYHPLRWKSTKFGYWYKKMT